MSKNDKPEKIAPTYADKAMIETLEYIMERLDDSLNYSREDIKNEIGSIIYNMKKGYLENKIIKKD